MKNQVSQVNEVADGRQHPQDEAVHVLIGTVFPEGRVVRLEVEERADGHRPGVPQYQHLDAIVNDTAGVLVEAFHRVRVVLHPPAVHDGATLLLRRDVIHVLPRAVWGHWQVVLEQAGHLDGHPSYRRQQAVQRAEQGRRVRAGGVGGDVSVPSAELDSTDRYHPNPALSEGS